MVPLSRKHRTWLHRAIALVLALAVVPLVVALGTFADEAPIREGEPAPRTVIADQPIRIVDREATEEAQDRAEQAVAAQEVFDVEAASEILADVRQVFAAARAARTPRLPDEPAGSAGGATPAPAPEPTVPPRSVQLAVLQEEIGFLSEDALRVLVNLSDAQLDAVSSETIDLAQELARLRISEGEVDQILDEQLPLELRLRSFPSDVEQTLVEPLIRAVMRPTMQVDLDATEAARQRAREQVPEVARTWTPGEPIVREGEPVDAIEMQALRQRGLEGTDPWEALWRAVAAMVVVTAVVTAYLRFLQPSVWGSGRRILLLGAAVTGYAVLVIGANLLVDATSTGWWFALPAGALAMLAAILVAPVAGLAMVLPAAVLPLLVAPEVTGAVVFVVSAVLLCVPLVTRIASRGDLRTATFRAGLSFPVLAAVSVLVFGPADTLGVAALAGVVNGVLTAVLVQGALPFLESLFRLPTVTALLDLADRNHPLLRELEAKALGSYNHSVMVASLVERACRDIGANALLGNVAALYHDIGKVRQPHFFIENQQGIANPHDELEPEISAVIIQNHVVDGVEMAEEHKLPPEVVACIGSHHGTMLVTYFYRKALDRVGGDLERVDVDHYRYKGTKPRSKEAGVLLMADCCEAATRSAAMERGTLPRAAIESICDRLIQERVDDGQFARCELTFDQMTRVRHAIVEALVGIYHPRIAYPEQERRSEAPQPEPDRVATP